MVKAQERGTSKACDTCGLRKALSGFDKIIKPSGKVYFRNKCKKCRLLDSRERYANNPESRDSKRRSVYAWRERNPKQVKRINARRHKKYYPANRAQYLARYRKRQKHVRQATPPWANLKKIERIYMLASWASKFTDERLECDHIIPLQGESICGLHVENNLQILTRSENRAKWNKFDDDIV